MVAILRVDYVCVCVVFSPVLLLFCVCFFPSVAIKRREEVKHSWGMTIVVAIAQLSKDHENGDSGLPLPSSV